MEHTLLNRVYINPNFKRTQVESRPTEPARTTHFNRHYHEVKPNMDTDTNSSISNNRKIYLNPYFINANNTVQNVTQEKSQQIGKKVLSNQVLFKSKYSLIHDVQPKCSPNLNKQSKNYMCRVNENMIIETNTEPYESTRRSISVQGLPLTRSRYCIVRKNNKLSVDLETTNKSSIDLETYKYQGTGSKDLIQCRNVHGLKHCENNKMTHKPPEKITKIKISKYKTIPVNYLRTNNNVDNSKNKLAVSPNYPKRNVRYSSTIITPYKNRFRFIKTNTPQKANSHQKTMPCNVSKVKTTSRIIQQAGKKLNASKLKILTTKFKINNIPCRLYSKYGKCLRQDQGNCKYLHDKKHVSLCRKFLRGICHDKDCSLSHELTAKKMPTCYFYLRGMCTKESCPYLHVKLNERTKICQEFSKGYCENGDICPFRHIKIDTLHSSRKISKDTLRKHSQIKNTEVKQIKIANDIKHSNSAEKLKKVEQTMNNEGSDSRYYKESVDSEATCSIIKPIRCKLGILPSFIQL